MGQSSLTLYDGTVFNIEDRFPSKYKTVGVSLSSGVESSILLPLLVDRYGADNVHVFTGYIAGRRNWESKRAVELSKFCNVKNVHVIQDQFMFMSPAENVRLREIACGKVKLDAWFAGAQKLRFSRTFYYDDPSSLERAKQSNIEMPFIDLTKSHTVDLHYKYNNAQTLFTSHSCTEQGEFHCGECYCCWERVRGFADIGKIDQARYGVPWEEMLQECFYTDKHFNKNW